MLIACLFMFLAISLKYTLDSLQQIKGNISLPVPLLTLIKETWLTYNSSFSHPLSVPFSPSPFFYTPFHELLNPSNFSVMYYYQCPYTSVTVVSPICSLYTRTKLHVNNTGNWSLLNQAYEDCNTHVDWLPENIYLPQAGSFKFTLNYSLQLLGEKMYCYIRY